jgi:hypothetical protein
MTFTGASKASFGKAQSSSGTGPLPDHLLRHEDGGTCRKPLQTESSFDKIPFLAAAGVAICAVAADAIFA